MCEQADGVAKGSPLGPALASIFVDYFETKLFSRVQTPTIYFQGIDDAFAIFKQDRDTDNSFLRLIVCTLLSSLRLKKNKVANLRF